ncbi:transposase [Bradyrhizobium sp. AUGA SZCCT0045]|nr:transposase [Bradyrhizobium sp. AUGA SZCCT0045]
MSRRCRIERQRRSFTEEFKRQAVELLVSSGRSITSVAKELGLRDPVLRRWVDKLRQEPASAALRPTTQATPMSADRASEIARLRQENERLRMERDILEKVDRDLCRNPDMSLRFIEDHRDTYPIRLMCAVLEVSPAGYYAWRERPVSARAASNSTLLARSGRSIATAVCAMAVHGSMPLCRHRDVVPAAAGSNG